MNYFIKTLVLFFLGSFSLNLFAQNEVSIQSSKKNETVITLKTDTWGFNKVKTPKGTQFIIDAPYASNILEKGAPDIPKVVRSIVIPDLDRMEVKVLSAYYKDYENVDIAPSKGYFSRSQNPEEIPYTYGEFYNNNEFYPGELTKLNSPYILRDFRAKAIDIYPFQYNPVAKTLRVYHEITLQLVSTAEKGENTFNRRRSVKGISPEFHEIYERQFINYHQVSKYDPLEEDGTMLVIAHPPFMEAMEPFVEWKNIIGLRTEMVSTEVTGTTWQNIASYIEDYYFNPENNLLYVLFVGDAEHIPPVPSTGTTGSGYSDNYYGYLEGDDKYQEIFIGRFSAETISHVETQVQRTIEYEMAHNFENGWLNVAMGIAAKEGEGSGHNGGEADDYHMELIRDKLLNHNYGTVHRHYHKNSTYAANTTVSSMSNDFNDGVGVVNFCNHGSATSWAFGINYTNSHVNALTNVSKLPFIWSVACVNGEFQGQTCFAETWLRATFEGEPTGAVAFFGSTINQDWHPPMDAQDEFNDILIGSYENNIKRTFGGISINGVYKMLDLNNNIQGWRTAETWTIFGDPSVKIRTDDAKVFTVTHAQEILMGSEYFTVACDVDNAFAVLTLDGEIVSTAKSEGGEINLPVHNVLPDQNLVMAITGYNKVPYIKNVLVIAPEGPYVIFSEYKINGNSSIDYGQSANIAITLKNVGTELATNISATLSSEDEAVISLSDNTEISFGNINTQETSTVTNNFLVTLSDSITNGHRIPFSLEITDENNNAWSSNFNLLVSAPKLEIGTISIDDTSGGNGDGTLDPGETADLKVTINNIGDANVDNLDVMLSILENGDDYLTVNSTSLTETTINSTEGVIATFSVTAQESTPLGTQIKLRIEASAGANGHYQVTKETDIVIGFVPQYCVSSATSPQDSDLLGVVFGDLVNYTEPGGTYDDFTDVPELIHEFMLGATYDIEIALGTAGGTYLKGAKVFIDWNYDGYFTGQNETVFEVTPQDANWTAKGSVTIPNNISLGPKYMRVVVKEASSLADIEPCNTYNWGGTEDYKIIIVSSEPPNANFEANITETAEGDIISFTDLTNRSPISWDWSITPGEIGVDYDFVEGTTATSRNPKVQFWTTNAYSIELTATNIVGSGSEQKVDYISIAQMDDTPVANFAVDHNVTKPGSKVRFTDLSTNVPIEWDWSISPGIEGREYSFVDGTDANSKNPVVTFKMPGFYSITLIATNVVGPSSYSQDDLIEVLSTFLMNDGSYYTCSGTFFDSGGPNGNYKDNEDYTITFYPATEQARLLFQFSYLNIEENSNGGCWDILNVYDGPDTESPLVGSYCGNTVPSKLQNLLSTHETGAITFRFTSDDYLNLSGWEANISCHEVQDDPTFNITFTVTLADKTPIQGAAVNLTGYNEQVTDHFGEVVFIQVESDTEIPFTITHNDFHNFDGALDVIDNHLNLKVQLVPLNASTFFTPKLIVFPNPFFDNITVISNEKQERIDILNILGQLVESFEVTDCKMRINTQDISPGVYFVLFISKTGDRVVKRMIKN